MIRLNREETKFGRHQSFPLRFSWPTKGYRYWCEGHDVFKHEEPSVALGVGKNMVASIRYWLEACQLAIPRNNAISQTEIGSYLLSPTSGVDQYLEDDTTIWLLHWLLTSNANSATTFFWFFNHFHKPEFTQTELQSALADYLQQKLSLELPTSTIENDISVLLRMYGGDVDPKTWSTEDSLQSPMSELQLINPASDRKRFQAKNGIRREVPVVAFCYAVLDQFASLETRSLPVSRLLAADEQFAAVGSSFRLSEEGLIAKLEELTTLLPKQFELRETAGLHQLFLLSEQKKIETLDSHYQQRLTPEKAA